MFRDNYVENQNMTPNTKTIEKLKADFPEFFGKDGEFLMDRFRKVLKQDEIEISKEGYELNFLGKSYARYLSSTKPETFIAPHVKDNEKDENKNSENLYIIGDNIEALKHLLNSYSGKIKCIYIDPPYNTGSDGFVYPDNFQYDAQKLSEMIGIEENEAEKIINLKGKSSHSAWLTFMYPRLTLARELLSDDGVIFISIDDNEQSNLKLMCDEIFGEENFVASITRNTNSSKNQSQFISVSHEYCIIYGKNISFLSQLMGENKWEVYKNNVDEYKKKVKQLKSMGSSDEEITAELKILTNYPRFIDFTNYWYFDERGLYQKGDLGGVKNGNMTPIVNPLTGKEDPIPPGGFRYNEETLQKLMIDNRIHFHKDGSLPRLKRYLDENIKQRPKSIMSDDQRPDNKLLKEFNTPFPNPKQMTFMQRILSIFDKDSLFLDFFSGSATTAHAVMQLNAEDYGNRKYILVQLPELIKKDDDAYKAGYRTIDEIGRERIRRAAKKIKEETGADIDYGFKTYSLSNINDEIITELEEFKPSIKLLEDDMVSIFNTENCNGKDAILSTFLVTDGYGLSEGTEKYTLVNYKADIIKDSLYLIDNNLKSEDVMELIKRIENFEIDINRIVVYAYSINFNTMHELKKNLSNLRNNKYIELIERY